jgi:uncharacterized protein
MKTLLTLIFVSTFTIGISQPLKPHHVNDLSDILSLSQEDNLTSAIIELEKTIGSQMAVLIMDSIPSQENLEDFSLRTLNQWRLGRKDYNDGILITVLFFKRQVRIEVGTGLEKIITNKLAAEIIARDIVPQFREEKYFEGLSSAIASIKKLIKDNKVRITKSK